MVLGTPTEGVLGELLPHKILEETLEEALEK